jgi:hypothetical protein
MQPGPHMSVVGNVAIVVEIDKGMVNDGVIKCESSRDQKQPKNEVAPPGRGEESFISR